MESKVVYRVVHEIDELTEMVELQKKVWGGDVVTSLPQMLAASHNGGVVIGAFREQQLMGFCYGFAGFDGVETYLCSHMLAIYPEYRDFGLGRTLKLRQREWALNYGYKKMFWTFDPLESRNGYLNLCKLGGYVKKYIPSYYGEMKDQINQGLDSDRFLLEWKLDSKRAIHAAAGGEIVKEEWRQFPKRFNWKLAGDFPKPIFDEPVEQEAEGYLIAVPGAIHQMKEVHMPLAREWRMAIRGQMMEAFAKGYTLVGLVKTGEPVNYYVVEKEEADE